MAAKLRIGDVVGLAGPLGAGKSTLAQAIIGTWIGNKTETIPSPTFTLMETYSSERGAICHADLYRLDGPEELRELGLEDYFQTHLTFIEWPDRAQSLLPPHFLLIAIEPESECRVVQLIGDGSWSTRLIDLALAGNTQEYLRPDGGSNRLGMKP